MLQESFNPVEVIEMAKDIEKEGYEFYHEQADQADDSDLRELFLRLASDEDSHYQRFTKLAESIKKEVREKADYVFEEEASAYLRALVEFSVFPQENEMEIDTTEKALLFAVRAEKESIIIYQEMLNHNKGETAEIVAKILQEEKQHLIDLVKQMNKSA